MNGFVLLKNGYWQTIISYKDNTGKRKKKWESTGLKERGNKKKARKLLEERLKNIEEDLHVKEEKIKKRYNPVDEILTHRDMPFTMYISYYIDSIKDKISPYVYSLYSKNYLNVFKSFFKDMKLIDVTHEEITSFNNHLLTKGLSTKSVVNYSNAIRPALKKAFLDKVIPDNPYDRVRLPRISKPVLNYYNKDEITKLFEATKGHKLNLVYKMLAYYGFRRSELLGLKWQAIDFDHDTISINHKVMMVDGVLLTDNKLKSKSSNRTLPLLPNIKTELIEHKKRIEENKLFVGDSYDKKWSEYVFVNELGKLYTPDYLTHTFSKTQKKYGLKRIRLHDLRHSCASLLLANGINLKQIQDWLGHADFSTTANVYAHLDFSSKIQSANSIYNALAPTSEIVNDKNLDNIVLALTKEMARLGFSSLDEYFNYRKTNESKTTDYEM